MGNNTTCVLFRILLLFYVLWGGYAWFTWELETDHSLELMVYAVGFVITLIYQFTNKVRLRPKRGVGMALVVLFFLYLYCGGFSGTGYITAPIHFVLRFYPILVLLCDKDNVAGHLSFIAKAIAFILILSMVLYLVMQFLPIVPGLPINWEEASDSYFFINYFILIRNIYYVDDFWRFTSIFLEPSYLATVCLFLLFANRFGFHLKENKILGLALVFSTSLAGYIVGFIGYILMRIVNRKSYAKLLILPFLFAMVYMIGVEYNEGDNLINRYIIERLQFDEEKGIVGNNRTGEQIDALFEKSISDGSIIWGIGQERLEKYATTHGAGYKMAFLRNGIISVVLLFLFYWFVGVSGQNGYKKRFMMAFIMLYIVMFIPNAALLSYMWLIPFILASASDVKKFPAK